MEVEVSEEQKERYIRYMKAISQVMGRQGEGAAVETSRIKYQHLAYIPAESIECTQWLGKADLSEIIG